MPKKQILLEVLLVIAIFAIALAVRTYQLDEFPPGLYNDEAAYGMDGLAVLRGEHAVFFERNNGREPLFIYLLALVFQFFGATPYTVRLAAALVGAVTVITTYWMVRALFRFAPDDQVVSSRWFAAWSALFLAFSYWHLSFSRLGFRAITLPLVMTIAFALLWMTWRRLRQPGGAPWALAIATGVALGLTLYTYTAGRMAFALFFATVLVTVILAPRFALARRRLLTTAGIVLGFAVLTAMPLLLYFLLNPAYFAEHAAEVSIFNPKYSGGDPIGAFVNSLTKTLLMFFNTPDRNPRHNPAQIPVFDPLLAVWLAFGLLVATVTWRKLTTSFSVMWFILFIAPAILSGEGIPHSLRTIGLLPIVYVLPLLGMAWIIARTPNRFHRIMRWLPAPFLAVAAFVSLTSYFGAWSQIDRFRPAFFVDFVDLAYGIQQPDAPAGLWILPLPGTEELSDGKLNTIDFLMEEPGKHYATLVLDEATTASELTQLAAGHDQVFVLQTMNLPEHRRFQTKFADTRGMLNLLLRRNSVGQPVEGGTMAGIPYTIYELVDKPDFALPDTEQPADGTFGNVIHLTSIHMGGLSDTETNTDAVHAIHADDPLWTILRWQALEPITATLKTSFALHTEAGDRMNQIDGFLGGNRYPLTTDWLEGEQASTYHVLEIPPGLAPGRYTLDLRVYEDESGVVYSAQTASDLTQSLKLATIDILPPRQPGANITPHNQLDAPVVADQLEPLGYDLFAETMAPGDSLPAAFYFRSLITPTTDYVLRLTLYDAAGTVAAEQSTPVGSTVFPTSRWRPGEVVRTPITLRTEPTLANGEYILTMTLQDGNGVETKYELTRIELSGRPRLLTAPLFAISTQADFGNSIRLLGIDASTSLTVAPGSMLSTTLVWQPLQTETRNLVRFTQLLNDAGQLVAQQDTIPCNGECPGASWLPGEFLLDSVALNLPPDLAPGDYQLITGWYDADTQQRLAATDAGGAPLPDNVALLPIVVRVMP